MAMIRKGKYKVPSKCPTCKIIFWITDDRPLNKYETHRHIYCRDHKENRHKSEQGENYMSNKGE